MLQYEQNFDLDGSRVCSVLGLINKNIRMGNAGNTE